MRRTLLVLTVLLVACGGSPGTASPGQPTSAPSVPAVSALPVSGPPSPDATSASSDAPPASAGAGTLPADCADGLGAFLTAIEPIVSEFDPATMTLGDLIALDDEVGSKSIELLQANDSRATYDCTAVGLEWAYFDAQSPWDLVLAFAGEAAPETVPFLTAIRDEALIDLASVTDYGIEGCEAAVAAVKERIAALRSGGVDGARDLPLADALGVLGLYKAYLREVGDGICPRDQLGNDEFDFFLGVG